MRLRVVALALAAVAPAGCITSAGNHLTDIAPSPGPVRPSIEQTVGDFSLDVDGIKLVTSNKTGRVLNDDLLDRWRESGFIADHRYVESARFSEASVFRLTLEGRLDERSSFFLQIVSGLTLTLVPFPVDSRMNLRYSLANTKSGCVFHAKATDSYRTVACLLLLPAAPFLQEGRTRTLDRIADHLYAQLADQGAFEDHASCGPEPAAADSATPMDLLEPSIARQLRDLDRMRAEGLLSEAEYERKRDEIQRAPE
jgi:hypothetical protein